MARPRIAITCGEPAGIGPEIALRAALDVADADCLLVGDAAQLKALAMLIAPARVPPAVIERLNAEAKAALAAPTVQARFADLGITPVGNSPDEFRTFVASETKRWGEVAKRAKITLE